MKFIIRSHEGALALVREHPQQFDVIYITSPHMPYPVEGSAGLLDLGRSGLMLQFDDVDGPIDGLVAPQRAHVAAALDWARGKSNFLIACRAGISRSSATAVVLRASQCSPVEALEVLTPGMHYPNPLIICHGEEILGLHGLSEAVREWKRMRGFSGLT